MSEFRVTDHSAEVKREMADAVLTALEAIGIQATSHTIANITESSVIDTGLMKNSMAFALSGEAPKDEEGNAKTTYKSNETDKNGKPVKPVKTGKYEGTAPKDPENKQAVYIGSGVYYAAYQETGYVHTSGKHVEGKHYLQRAIEEHKDEYRAIAEKYMGGK